MGIHHTSLYNTDENKPTRRVLKPELLTYEETDFGLKILGLSVHSLMRGIRIATQASQSFTPPLRIKMG